MKKLTTLVVLLFLFMISIPVVFAAEGDEPVTCEEPLVLVDGECVEEGAALYQEVIAAFQSWASLKNFILSFSGLAILTFLYRLRKIYKFVKSPDGTESVYKHVETFLARITKKPELVIQIVNLVAQLPIIQGLIKSFQKQVANTEKQLRYQALDIGSKIDLDVYSEKQKAEARALLLELEKDNAEDSE